MNQIAPAMNSMATQKELIKNITPVSTTSNFLKEQIAHKTNYAK
jgi:hypothetical protein